MVTLSDLYIMKAASGIYKIGRSVDVNERRGQVECRSGEVVTIAKVFVGCGKWEKHVHKLLAKHRLHGEWFSYSADLGRIIALSSAEELAQALPSNVRRIMPVDGDKTQKDVDDLAMSSSMIDEGNRLIKEARMLRKRVLNRMRVRKCRRQKA